MLLLTTQWKLYFFSGAVRARGGPEKVVFDQRSQLKSKENVVVVMKLDWEPVKAIAAMRSTKWMFVPVGAHAHATCLHCWN